VACVGKRARRVHARDEFARGSAQHVERAPPHDKWPNWATECIIAAMGGDTAPALIDYVFENRSSDAALFDGRITQAFVSRRPRSASALAATVTKLRRADWPITKEHIACINSMRFPNTHDKAPHVSDPENDAEHYDATVAACFEPM
jgi:hypothetical protein